MGSSFNLPPDASSYYLRNGTGSYDPGIANTVAVGIGQRFAMKFPVGYTGTSNINDTIWTTPSFPYIIDNCFYELQVATNTHASAKNISIKVEIQSSIGAVGWQSILDGYTIDGWIGNAFDDATVPTIWGWRGDHKSDSDLLANEGGVLTWNAAGSPEGMVSLGSSTSHSYFATAPVRYVATWNTSSTPTVNLYGNIWITGTLLSTDQTA